MTWNAEPLAGPCPCGRSGALAECCGPYLAGERPAPDPESLMRSRYTAFALGTREAVEYLIDTHHPDHRGPDIGDGLRATIDGVDAWELLEVISSGANGDRGAVHFVATYRVGGEQLRLRERSSFVREGGCWLYTQGVIG